MSKQTQKPKNKMWHVPFTKTTHGFWLVEAKDADEARLKAQDEDADEYDNMSEYALDNPKEVV